MRLRSGFLGVLFVVALVLSTVVFAGFALHRSAITTQERQALESDAWTVATDIDTRLREKRSTVALWASNDAVADHGSTAQQRAVTTLRRQTAFEGASVVAANGTMTAFDAADASPEDRATLVGQDFGDRTYVQTALRGQSHISTPFEAESGNYVVILSAPIRTNGTVVGTLNAAFHLTATDFFERATASLTSGRSLRVATRADTTLYDQSREFDAPLTATATVESTGWRVTVAADRTPLERRLRQSTGLQVGAVLATLLVVASLGVWASRRTIEQIERLSDGLGELEAGEYDTSLDLGPATEWRRISDRFDALAATLDRRESQLSVFSRVFRHNLRNDMSVIMLSTERILSAEDTDEAVQSSAERIYSRAESFMATTEHARTIHDELLDGRPATPVPADVRTVIEDVAHSLRTRYPEATVEASVADAAVVDGGRRLPIVLTELGENAIAHNDQPPGTRHLAFDAWRADETVAIAVSDDGPGMPETERELLVGNLEETPTAHGSGLGLWLVKWLVDSLDGSIAVSTPDGEGTTVTVRVPVDGDEEG
ncbi:sensor histidine kinase [Haloarcula pellucida]|uniref:histidine kinase n=1 Tax=Haloarcula pellucida TaxID=1427151 RepID=A0A830GN09_9EURY|nr:sensor histidine kinase [Halomicroarcula pellucida]MBX0348007.1 sensor histidine kinase [Halomicroarcula pellucida]GGN96480.1 histidine kinase [Halomicroarcula pellucida]